MAQIVDSTKGGIVVVNRARTVATVQSGTQSIRVPKSETAIGVVTKETAVVNVAAPGPQGRPGPEGPEGPGDNETFDSNLALLYSIAKL